MNTPDPCRTCGAPPARGRTYPDGQHWTWTHLGYCWRGRMDRRIEQHGRPWPYEPGTYLSGVDR